MKRRCFLSGLLAGAAAAQLAGKIQTSLPGLSISVTPPEKARDRSLQVTFHNGSDTDILIPLGIIVRDPHPTLLKIHVMTPGGQMPEVVYTGAGVVGGYAEPLTMGLQAGEAYTLALPLDRYYVLGRSAKLTTLMKRRCRLWVELEVKDDQCPNPARLDTLRRKLPCWHGKAVSNVLELP